MRLALFAVLALGLVLGGCHMGESTAPKPDPSRFLPPTTAGGEGKPITPNSPNNPN